MRDPVSKDPILETLRGAARGLLFPSETEAPLAPFAWTGETLTSKKLLELSGAKPGTAVEESTLAVLLEIVPSEDRAKFNALEKTLESLLSDIKVYKVGAEAEKAVYIVGKAKDGRWAGLKTTVVET
jgi:hypothetical protein